MRNADSAHRTMPLWAKLMLTAGFAVAGWLLAAALGASTASADEPSGHDTTTAPQPGPARGLGQLVGGTLNTVPGTVDTVLGTTLSTVQTVTGVVTATTQTVVTPVVETVVRPATDAVAAVTAPATKQKTVTTETRADVTRAPVVVHETGKPAVAAPAQAAPAPSTPIAHREAAVPKPSHARRAPAVPPVSAITNPVRIRDEAPVPAPVQPQGQTCGVTVSHDNGGNSKNQPAILTTRAASADLLLAGTPRRATFLDSGRDPALPTTSPD
ncbi:hypothetical protein HFP15_19455 [Amycolatopsis sp. K13G38]|uniref:Uncharacterized protein n=1 Tax=Amycolatopsis acididurans TaxID=2724524 RepID=A0ABX1J5N7_9PSEU|nr:hypothetical protein [Amycolatopsis acididurans]NKQ55063.1 hypothetical protein [Amycolatopsis acididurans]